MVTVKNAKKLAYRLTPKTIISDCEAYSRLVRGYMYANPSPVMEETTKNTESMYF